MRLYEYRAGMRGMAFDKPEERAFVSAWEQVKPHVPPDQEWARELERHYYRNGEGLAEFLWRSVLKNLVRCGMTVFTFEETDPSEFVRLNDRNYKSRARAEWREQYRELDPAGRKQWLADALHEMSLLPPPHRSFDEYEAVKTELRPKLLSQPEQARRAQAVVVHRADLQKPVEPSAREKIMKQLTVAARLNNDEIVARIVSGIDPLLALDMVEQFDHPAIATALLQRSLETA